jgi:hypothetical protein
MSADHVWADIKSYIQMAELRSNTAPANHRRLKCEYSDTHVLIAQPVTSGEVLVKRDGEVLNVTWHLAESSPRIGNFRMADDLINGRWAPQKFVSKVILPELLNYSE